MTDLGVHVVRLARTSFAPLLAVAAVGCAAPLPTPEQIPVLEADLREAPDSPETLRSLGIAYREAGRVEDARTMLERAVALDPSDGASNYFLGLTAEDQEDYARATEVYEEFLASDPDSGLRDDVEDRLVQVRRLALLEEVRSSVAQEQTLAGRTPANGTVGVFPFRYSGQSEAYRPLSTALAELLSVDLDQVDRLTVLERFRVKALLDEIALSDAGLVEPASASRSGRLLGAENIVQGEVGALGQDGLSTTALVVESTTGEGGDQVGADDAAERFIDMEKEVALGLFESMGVQLTQAERERILENRTTNLQALLAFGSGLEALDAGDFPQASTRFEEAVALDPGFGLARSKAAEAESLDRAAGISTTVAVAAGVQVFGATPEIQEWLARRYDFLDIEALTPSGVLRNPLPELLGGESVLLGGGSPVLRVLFPRPGGQQ